MPVASYLALGFINFGHSQYNHATAAISKLLMQVRPNSKTELSSTLVLKLDLEEVSAKVRTGGPKDEEKDYQLEDVWAGILPFAPLKALAPIDDVRLIKGIPQPPSVTDYRRPGSKD
jgi:hypothetical protein